MSGNSRRPTVSSVTASGARLTNKMRLSPRKASLAAGRIRKLVFLARCAERFAYRELWNIGAVAIGLLRFDVRRPDYLAPLLGFVGDELAEVGGRARKWDAADLCKPRAREIGRASCRERV